ncbi:hypothetical protein BD780_002896 [Clostridium tetanomorphum]|uniref:DUF5673 domain-containing protein n=1 Tax=Clostridium tetanomorphum TaxID=1553 RepID=A0A923IZE6_CLOTT|nr:hypothetical protein [Clostridium tetanomorphum]KAJ48686.1 hypothetical protein CTM_27060 [Clostridium tetanomorphum DSM 665]KAJ53760.1 hypothetical protein CTM_00785 [Clostridium tetanomorphum DSM 665]MBC2397271.1 hypothetical protein [Clostridium tetanomorphum]MBP1862488.1 hypothetical protein [Clostridium tetanomorphum]NRS85671.1 hypothetical protein [Clostridium tetanomorphum]
MSIVDIIIPLLFIVIILKQLRYIKELIIPTKKSYIEIITVLFSIGIFMWIIYFYANTWIHYVTGALGIFMFVSIWIKQGINSKGFVSMYKYKETILWNEIEKVIIISSKDIKLQLLGGFIEQTFHFKNSDYDRVITILKENLPKQAQLQTILNK